MDETSTLYTANLKYSSCIDINGKIQPHGNYYTPVGRPCSQCPCSDGHPGVCIMLSCEKPKCLKFKQVYGKCCDYKCLGDYDFTDKATLGIVISLSIILVFTLIAIIFVLRKMRRKKQFGERLSSVSLNSQHQQLEETDIDDIIQRNSIPNNLRHQTPVQTSSSCSYNKTTTQKLNNTKTLNLDSCELTIANDLQKYSSELSCNSACENDIEYSSQSDDSSHNIKIRRFEPSLPYTALSSATFI